MTRIVTDDLGNLQVPANVAPDREAAPIDHLMFGLRYEGINPEICAALFGNGVITAGDIIARFQAAPSSQFARRAAYLYEILTGELLEGHHVSVGNYVHLFDRDRYITREGEGPRSQKWRIEDNGLSPLASGFSPLVRRTAQLQRYLELDLFSELRQFVERARGLGLFDRALEWAYLAETQDSFEIEKESPSPDKQRRFVRLLAQAHESRALDEAYLVELQQATVTPVSGVTVAFRESQNYLVRGGVGAASVRYVPPSPKLARSMMNGLCAHANRTLDSDPVVKAAIDSFGFVLIHPFRDGNGRLSRFLFHHSLCHSGVLEQGLLLPVSVAMKKNERRYLEALESFSLPARHTWDITYVGQDDVTCEFRGNEWMYRAFDATAMVEFGFACAWEALNEHLTHEVEFLDRFDRIYREVDTRFDIENKVLNHLIVSALQHGGSISHNVRKKYALVVPGEALHEIEAVAQRVMAG